MSNTNDTNQVQNIAELVRNTRESLGELRTAISTLPDSIAKREVLQRIADTDKAVSWVEVNK